MQIRSAASISFLFAGGDGPQSNAEFCYGNGEGIVGVFEKAELATGTDDKTKEEYTYIANRDNGSAAEEWFAGIVGESDWANANKAGVIASVFESDATITARIYEGEASLTIKVENGNDSILIGLSAKATAGEAYEFTAIDTTDLLVIAL